MKGTKQQGFTIIETMLFLAVTGLLVISILVGAGGTVNRQRYIDAVNSFAALLRDQYSNVTAIHNDRTSNWDCTNSKGVYAVPAGTGSSRGASMDCAIVGQIIQSSDGKTISIDPVIARHLDSALNGATSDISSLQVMTLESLGAVDSSQIESQALDWGVSLSRPSSGMMSTSKFSILVLRSPLTGGIETFINPTNGSATPASLISAANQSNSITFCVNSQGLTSITPISVTVNSNASTATDIRNNGGDSAC